MRSWLQDKAPNRSIAQGETWPYHISAIPARRPVGRASARPESSRIQKPVRCPARYERPELPALFVVVTESKSASFCSTPCPRSFTPIERIIDMTTNTTNTLHLHRVLRA